MMKQGMRRILTLFSAGALGLSCTGCLAPSVLHSSSSDQQYSSTGRSEDPELVRLSDAHQAQRATPTRPATSYPITRTPRRVSGVDMAVSEFAEASQGRIASPYSNDFSGADRETNSIDAQYGLVANSERTGLGLDLSVNPHISVDQTGGMRSTRAGAEVRIGANLDRRGSTPDNSNWYFFAGADGEAVVWDVQRAGSARIVDGDLFSLQDRVTVGDVQAGVAFESPAGQMSVSYIEREYQYRNGAISRSGEEKFVALTLSWTH